jgi:hypothetical protein
VTANNLFWVLWKMVSEGGLPFIKISIDLLMSLKKCSHSHSFPNLKDVSFKLVNIRFQSEKNLYALLIADTQ